MRAFFKKILSLLIVYSFVLTPVMAENKLKLYGNINDEFTLRNKDLPDEISFTLTEARKVREDVTIPERAVVNLKVINARRELRWHVSGIVLCKLLNYVPENSKEKIDLTDKDIYLVVRKYEPIKGKEAGILTTEIILTQAAGIVGSCFIFFAPVDIAYFFTKGAIKREKDPNWFRAGVKDAYDNSIFWFQLKGKPIELSENDAVSVKEIKSNKAKNLNSRIKKRAIRENKQHDKRISKFAVKDQKRELKYERKEVPCSVIEQAIDRELGNSI